MDKEQAIHSFWSGFDIPAYDENSVPDGAQMPYITYNVSTGALEDVVLLHASLWYYDTSWADITHKAHEIEAAVGSEGHVIIPIDNGRIFLTQGAPFAQRMMDEADSVIKRIYINVNAEFLTAY